MKKSKFISLLYIICGIFALSPVLSSCNNEVEPISAEELFLRAFIKQYGLIDPKQDWNQAERSSVTVDVDHATEINVFVHHGDCYYRVAYFVNVEGSVEIPLDIPENTDTLWVDIDGLLFATTPGGHVDATAKANSRAAADYTDQLWGWQKWGARSTQGIPMTVGTYLDCSERFYMPNAEANCDDDDVNTSHYANVSSDHYSLLNLAQGTKVYMQMHNELSKVASFILKFHTSVTSPATIHVRVSDLASVTLSLEGEQDHEIMILNMGDSAWPQTGIYVAEGTVNSIGNFSITEFAGSDMTWLLVAEDLGSTEDFDFNDIVIKISALTTNTVDAKIQNEFWQVIEDEDEHIVLSRAAPASRAVSYTKLQITALAAGGILDAYLHFSTGNDDYVLSPGDWDLTNNQTHDALEWHSWFVGGEGGNPNERQMINTGFLGSMISHKPATIVVPSEFSLTTYSRIFRVYDETDGTADYESWNNSSEWERGKGADYKIVGFYLTIGAANKADAERLLGAPKAGAAPQMFLIPDAGTGGCWHWPRERVSITEVYPKFKGWASNANPQWYLETPNKTGTTHEGVTVNQAYIERIDL